MTTRRTFQQCLLMVDAMKRKPHTFAQLSDLSGLSLVSVQRWFKTIRQNCYVGAYVADARGRLFVPAWRWGEGKDAPRPGQQYTGAERMRNLRLRRANPDLY